MVSMSVAISKAFDKCEREQRKEAALVWFNAVSKLKRCGDSTVGKGHRHHVGNLNRVAKAKVPEFRRKEVGGHPITDHIEDVFPTNF